MNELKYVFLFGRPGCGKSAVYRHITEMLSKIGLGDKFERIDDFPRILKLNEEDRDFKRHKVMPDGGFLITDPELWNDVLRLVDKDARSAYQEDKIIFIEFARNSYLEALKNFSDEILNNAIIIYIYSPFELCWERNVERVKRQQAEGIDAHLTSHEEMEKTFKNDDMEILKEKSELPVFILDNSVSTINELEANIDKIVYQLFDEFGNGEKKAV